MSFERYWWQLASRFETLLESTAIEVSSLKPRPTNAYVTVGMFNSTDLSRSKSLLQVVLEYVEEDQRERPTNGLAIEKKKKPASGVKYDPPLSCKNRSLDVVQHLKRVDGRGDEKKPLQFHS